jgi:Protein of unknown function (DUF3828)
LRKFRGIANDEGPATTRDPHANTTHSDPWRCYCCRRFWRCLGAASPRHARLGGRRIGARLRDRHLRRLKDAKGHPLDNESAIRRYFEPSLAALMVKDQKIAAKRGEVGLLDFDPFIDAQDWEISNFDIAVDDSAPGKASATVKFTNFNKPATVRLDLVKVKNDWRIADITWLRDGKAESLRKIYGR